MLDSFSRFLKHAFRSAALFRPEDFPLAQQLGEDFEARTQTPPFVTHRKIPFTCRPQAR